MSDDPTFDCEGCGDLLTPGVAHDCPALGTRVELTALDGVCPYCGDEVVVKDRLTVRHFYGDALCPGSIQVPRSPEDRRPLWKDRVS